MATPLPISPFVTDADARFDAYFDPDRFMADVCEMPAFLVNPSPEYLQAIDLMPIVEILGAHAS